MSTAALNRTGSRTISRIAVTKPAWVTANRFRPSRAPWSARNSGAHLSSTKSSVNAKGTASKASAAAANKARPPNRLVDSAVNGARGRISRTCDGPAHDHGLK